MCIWLSIFSLSQLFITAYPEHITLDNFPNPLNDHQLCGRDTPSFICDPNKILSTSPTNIETLATIDKLILDASKANLIFCPRSLSMKKTPKTPKTEEIKHKTHSQTFDASINSAKPIKDDPFSRSHFRGLQIGISAISSLSLLLSSSIPENQIERLTKYYSKSIHDQWAIGDYDCNNGVMIFFSINDRSMYISTGSAVKLVIKDHFVTSFLIPQKIVPLMRAQKYANAIQFIVETMIEMCSKSDDVNQCDIHREYIQYISSWNYYFANSFPTTEIVFIVIILAVVSFIAYNMKKQVSYRECHRRLATLHAQQQAGRFDQTSCPICLEDFNTNADENSSDTSLLICGHKFCTSCLDSWFNQQPQSNQRCPICRQDRNDWSSALDNNDNTNDDENGDAKDKNRTETDVNDDESTDVSSEEKMNDNNIHGNGAKTSTSDSTFYDSNVHNSNNNGNGSGQQSNMRFRGRPNLENWIFRNELLFRMNRMRFLYPRYVDNGMVHRWSRQGYRGSYTQDTQFRARNPSSAFRGSSRNSSAWGGRSSSGFSFGGGSSFGGGGGGGRW